MEPCTLFGSVFPNETHHEAVGECAITVSFKSGRPAFVETVDFKAQDPACGSYPVPNTLHVPDDDGGAATHRDSGGNR
jgi:hypothetical protein